MFFVKTKSDDNLPEEARSIVEALKNSQSKGECLYKAYNFLSKKYQGTIKNNIINFFDLFLNENEVWHKKLLSCNTLNYLLKKILVGSKIFKLEEIESKWTFLWYFSPHQYLKIKMDDLKTTKIDLWAASRGIEFGDYAHGFHLKTKE